jgi:hypothetical protein
MSEPQLPTAPPARLSHRTTRSQLRDILSPAATVSTHDRQRALVQASLLTRPLPAERPRHRRGWVPG